jgi:alcohol dehydrogenase class IV
MSALPGSFSVGRLPRIVFGAGRVAELPQIAAPFGRRALLVTGGRSLRASLAWPRLLDGLHAAGVDFELASIESEPSPELVDRLVSAFHGKGIDVVVAIGGGSTIDAAKAIAGLLPNGNKVMDHLEGVGRNIPYHGPATPLIAVPTTAGTGSEATKNAVLSVHGKDGFKKSFRGDALVAQVALVDPELLVSCPPDLIAANGMDAFTQLLESLVSLRANPFTDALALSGIEAVRDGFFATWRGGSNVAAQQGRARMAYASLLSGITLAQAGLGSVHGLAAPLGAYFPIPHGVVCGTLVAVASEVNIRALQRNGVTPALKKYARVGRMLAETGGHTDAEALDALVDTLRDWTEKLRLPSLAHYGVGVADIPRIVAGARGTSMQTNPSPLSDAEVGEIVRARL